MALCCSTQILVLVSTNLILGILNFSRHALAVLIVSWYFQNGQTAQTAQIPSAFWGLAFGKLFWRGIWALALQGSGLRMPEVLGRAEAQTDFCFAAEECGHRAEKPEVTADMEAAPASGLANREQLNSIAPRLANNLNPSRTRDCVASCSIPRQA